MKYEIHIKGLRPLLYAKPPLDVERKKPGTKVTAEDQAKNSLYQDEKVGVYAPNTWFEGAMMAVASEFPLQGKKTFKDLVKSSVFVFPEKIPLITKDKYIIFKRLVKKGNGERVLLANALYENWEFKFEIRITDERLETSDKIIEIIKLAGINKAIGGWRPRYGTFEVVSFEKSSSVK